MRFISAEWLTFPTVPIILVLTAKILTYCIALGPQAGRKAFTLQTLPPAGSLDDTSGRVVKAPGFSLHAGVAAEAYERNKLERLCRTRRKKRGRELFL